MASNYGLAPGAGTGEDPHTAGQSSNYGEPSSNLQNINRDTSQSGNPADGIPIDNSIQHYELPNLTQCKL